MIRLRAYYCVWLYFRVVSSVESSSLNCLLFWLSCSSVLSLYKSCILNLTLSPASSGHYILFICVAHRRQQHMNEVGKSIGVGDSEKVGTIIISFQSSSSLHLPLAQRYGSLAKSKYYEERLAGSCLRERERRRGSSHDAPLQPTKTHWNSSGSATVVRAVPPAADEEEAKLLNLLWRHNEVMAACRPKCTSDNRWARAC